MFLLGLGLGVFIGATIGVMGMALLLATAEEPKENV